MCTFIRIEEKVRVCYETKQKTTTSKWFESAMLCRIWHGLFSYIYNRINQILTSLDRYLWWWTINYRGYHPPSSQCFYTDIVIYIYIYTRICFHRNLQFLNHVIIIQTKVFLPQVTLTNFSYPVHALWISCSQILLNYWLSNIYF